MRKFLTLTAILVALIVAGVPTLNGWWLRHQIAAAIGRLPDSAAFRLEHSDSRTGWINSTIVLRLHGEAVNAPAEGIPLELSVLHGPLIWHAFDSPWALAHLQLQTPHDYSGPGANRYSGAVVLQITPGGELAVRGILGGAAFDGDHQVQFTGRWPLLSDGLSEGLLEGSASIYLELDADALATSPAANALRLYQQQGWTRISQGRALTTVQLDDGNLSINGQLLPLRSLLGSWEPLKEPDKPLRGLSRPLGGVAALAKGYGHCRRTAPCQGPRQTRAKACQAPSEAPLLKIML